MTMTGDPTDRLAGKVLTRRRFAKTIIAAPGLLAVSGCGDREGGDADAGPGGEPVPGGDGWAGYGDAIVIDALASPGPFNVPDRIGQPLTDEMVRNAAASGITAVNVTVSGGGDDPDAAYAATLEHLAYWQREVEAHPDELAMAASVAEIEAAKAAGKLALIMGFQDTFMLGTDLARMDEFQGMGVPIVQLTYNLPNLVGEGCLSPGNGGLTDFGRDLVAHMADTGVLVDLSHCGQRTTAEAIAVAPGPVSITHSGCSAVYEHPRSKQDTPRHAAGVRGRPPAPRCRGAQGARTALRAGLQRPHADALGGGRIAGPRSRRGARREDPGQQLDAAVRRSVGVGRHE